MGYYTAKKPYHNLKKSIVAFYKSRINFMKELAQKFSEFEKPYSDSSYPEMNLKIPTPNWPTWVKPWIPNPWNPEISLPEFPVPEEHPPSPGPTSQFSPPPDDKRYYKHEGCLLYDVPLWVEPGKCYGGWFSGGFDSAKTPPFERPVMFWIDLGPASISGSGTYGFILCVNSDAEDQEIIQYSALGEWGSKCTGACVVFAGECPEDGVEIEYTTLVMTASSSQTLESSDGKSYWWHITDTEGELTKQHGKSCTIQAPALNPGCEQIEVSLRAGKATDAEECDSIAIDVTIPNCTDYSQPSFTHCCEHVWGEGIRCCFTSYDCEGIMVTDADSTCCSTGFHQPENCSTVPGCELENIQCAESWECPGGCDVWNPGPMGWTDQRTAGMITDGCCPGL